MSGRPSRRVQLALVFTLPSALFLALAFGVYSWFRIDVPARLGPAPRADAIAALRAGLMGEPRTPTDAALRAYELEGQGPAIAVVWSEGRPIARVEGRGPTADRAIGAAAEGLARSPGVVRLTATARENATISLDLVVARGPLLSWPSAFSLVGLHPGLEGLAVALPDGREVVLSPDELARNKALFAKRPIRAVPEISLGLDWPKIDRVLASRLAISLADWIALERQVRRVRVDGFVEQPPGRREQPPLPLTRGVTPGPTATKGNLRDAAIAGGRYLVAHLAGSGRYVYEVNLATGSATDPAKASPYSLPRHAGTTYYLAQLYAYTKEGFLREPIERAFAHLASLVEAGGCRGKTADGEPMACVVDRGSTRATLGSTALTVVALVEYRLATEDPRYDALSKELSEWMLSLQQPSGTFAHVYDVKTAKADASKELLYFTGEAAFALIRMYEAYKDPRYLKAAERALDYLTGWYDFFAGGFFYGEEHWTCIAAGAAWPHLKHQRYLDFCLGYGDFLRGQQIGPGDLPDQDDLAGAYAVSPFIAPSNTPAGSRSEAMISTYELARAHGREAPELREQILATMRYVLGQQIRPEGMYAVAPHLEGLGAIPSNPLDRKVRIDFVQHVCSAMIRATAFAPE
jgi:hypothetical protein